MCLRSNRIAAALVLLSMLMCGCTPATVAKSGESAGTATTLGGDETVGAKIFATNCSTCHGATGREGGAVGPSLRNEKERMDFGGTVSWIEDPEPPMPKLYPQVLSRQQVRDVAAYVQSL